ncbi:MAG: XTP/dITP diphosphatase [Clostridia bacterium]|nr:XTP/dITP diphosphatase [Clostridia bacterium]
MTRLIIATKNKGKVKEIKELLQGCDYEVLSLAEVGIDADVEEDGQTFEENSLKKAASIQTLTGGWVIADDSGIEIDFLNGAPGIYSARFLGEATDIQRYEGILTLLSGIPDEYRTARFVCAASVCTDEAHYTFLGKVEGRIAWEPSGSNGFGYDPVFYVPEHRQTVAQMDAELKNRISHRGVAFKLLAQKLKELSRG